MKIAKKNPMLVSLIIGCILYGIVGEIIIYLCGFEEWCQIAIGFLTGVLLMIGTVIHMAASIDISLGLDEQGALKHTRKMYLVRIAVVVVVFLLLFFLNIGNVVAALLGMVSLKVSAYIQPFTYKLIVARLEKGR